MARRVIPGMPLTENDRRVLRFFRDGNYRSVSEVAERMGLSPMQRGISASLFAGSTISGTYRFVLPKATTNSCRAVMLTN